MEIKPTRTSGNHESAGSKSIGRSTDSSLTPSSAQGTSPNDTVTLTQTAASMIQLEESLAQLPDIDDARVQSIRQAIADGSYQIDSDKLVANLLNSEFDFN